MIVKRLAMPLIASLLSVSAFSLCLAQETDDSADSIEIVVTDFSYYYNGTRTESLDWVESSILENLSAEYSVIVCDKADNDRVYEVVEILRDNVEVPPKLLHASAKKRKECIESN